MDKNITTRSRVNALYSPSINCLHWRVFLSYSDDAPYKTGVRRENLNIPKATHDAPSVFFCVQYIDAPFLMAWCIPLITVVKPRSNQWNTLCRPSMVALMGQPSGWLAFPFGASILTPVNVTTPIERENSGGDSLSKPKEIATMATITPPHHILNSFGVSSHANNLSISLLRLPAKKKPVQCFRIRLAFFLRVFVRGCNMANYKALDLNPQGLGDEVLYFDQDVTPIVLFECIYHRLDAVERLHDELTHLSNNDIQNKPISAVTAILLSDVKVMFWKMHDHAISLEDAQKEIAEYKNTINKLTEKINEMQAISNTEDNQ